MVYIGSDAGIEKAELESVFAGSGTRGCGRGRSRTQLYRWLILSHLHGRVLSAVADGFGPELDGMSVVHGSALRPEIVDSFLTDDKWGARSGPSMLAAEMWHTEGEKSTY